MSSPKILLGWTTVASARAAQKLAAGLIQQRLAACVQVDGPVTSHYTWQGKTTRTREWRLSVKFPSRNAKAVETWLEANHPYSTPQWLAIEVSAVAERYRKWVLAGTR